MNDELRYEIRVRGHLGQRWAAWFDGLSISEEAEGISVLRGALPDQAALHGLLHKVRDLGLTLESVTHVDAAEPAAPGDHPLSPINDNPTGATP